VLVEYSQPSEVAGMTAEIAEGADTVIWEGNSIAGSIDADLLVYIDGGGEERKDPALRESAHLLAEGPLDPESATRLAVTALGLLGAVPEGFCVRGKHWIELQGSPIMGDGRARLLEAVDSQGSILGASRSTGIPYKRAWTHIREAERSLGARLILPVRGGAGGGGTRLSPLGRRLLEAYRRAEAELRSQLEVIGI
jgi:molybdate transport system regulatory protein